MILIPADLDTYNPNAPKAESHSVIRATFFKEFGFWDMFTAERDRLKSLSPPPVAACWFAEGHVRGVIAEQNRMEAERANELGVTPVIGQSPEAAMAEQNDHVDRERGAEAKIRKLASGQEAELNVEISWAGKNIHRPWSELTTDVPSENAVTLWLFACGNEIDFRRLYHSKPKAVKDDGNDPEEIPESEQRVMERIEKLLAG